MWQEETKWRGDIEIITHQHRKIETYSLKNVITNQAKNLIRDVLTGVAEDARIRYVALGNGTSTPNANQERLDNELFRKPVTDIQIPLSTTGQLKTIAHIASFEANFFIQEIAWFAGPTATDTKDSGVMVARILYSKDKNNRMTLQIVRTDTILSSESVSVS